MAGKVLRFTPYNDGENGVLIGYGDPATPGEELEKEKAVYTVEEVRGSKGGMWCASLKRKGRGMER